ncbi:MAG: type II secretion system protein M [Chromatiales bacterium]|nr:type II secretion system protein M [Chromatiales bacterium]
MRRWWENLPDRDRRALAMIAMALAFAVVWFGAWEPLQKDKQRNRELLVQKEELLNWMQGASAEAKALAGSRVVRPATSPEGGSLLATVDRTVTQANLKSTVKRIEPEGSNKARLWMEEGSFDRMVAWLVDLQRSQGVAIEEIRVDAKADDGTVNARLTLQRGEADS